MIYMIARINISHIRLLDTDTWDVFDVLYSEIKEYIIQGKTFVENLRFDGCIGLVGWGGSMQRYTELNKQGRLLTPPSMVILARKNGIYTVASYTGKVKTVEEHILLNSLKTSNWRLANGKVRSVNGVERIVPIEGGYPQSVNRKDTNDIYKRLGRRKNDAKKRVDYYASKCKMVNIQAQTMGLVGDKVVQHSFKRAYDIDSNTLNIYIESITNTAIIQESDLVKLCKRPGMNIVIRGGGANLERIIVKEHPKALIRSCNMKISFDIKKSNIVNLDNMFAGCTQIMSIDFTGLHAGKIKTMNSVFTWCSSLTDISLGGLDTSECEDYSCCFSNCKDLERLDVSTLDTRSAVTLDNMFSYCDKLEYLDVSHFDVSNVTNFDGVFARCNKLKVLDLRNWNTQTDLRKCPIIFLGLRCEILLNRGTDNEQT